MYDNFLTKLISRIHV